MESIGSNSKSPPADRLIFRRGGLTGWFFSPISTSEIIWSCDADGSVEVVAELVAVVVTVVVGIVKGVDVVVADKAEINSVSIIS